jgi:phosphoserine aminotransferase
MIHNFSAGPGVLPQKVLQQVQSELLNHGSSGISVLEMSHRSKEFKKILANAENSLRTLLQVPTNYKILFMQGGASTQFSAVVLNLVTDLARPIDYIVTGQWSNKAFKEAVRLGAPAQCVYKPADGPLIPSQIKFNNAQYVYYCDNETVDGFELPSDFVNHLPSDSVVVCDMSSNFASRKVDVSKFGVIFGGAQKNMGPAGVTVVIVREDLLPRFEQCPIKGPLMLSYNVFAENGSMYNTPPTFGIYVCGLVFKHWLDFGSDPLM